MGDNDNSPASCFRLVFVLMLDQFVQSLLNKLFTLVIQSGCCLIQDHDRGLPNLSCTRSKQNTETNQKVSHTKFLLSAQKINDLMNVLVTVNELTKARAIATLVNFNKTKKTSKRLVSLTVKKGRSRQPLVMYAITSASAHR